MLKMFSNISEAPGLFLCGRNTPDPEKCGRKSIESMDRYFRSGIPEFKVLPLDPMFIEEVTIADIPDFHALSTNCNLNGLANFTLTHFKIDPKKQTIESILTYESLVLDMDFAVSAKIIVPIEEKGRLAAVTGECKKWSIFAKFQVQNFSIPRFNPYVDWIWGFNSIIVILLNIFHHFIKKPWQAL